jgi:hypothetical protein
MAGPVSARSDADPRRVVHEYFTSTNPLYQEIQRRVSLGVRAPVPAKTRLRMA